MRKLVLACLLAAVAALGAFAAAGGAVPAVEQDGCLVVKDARGFVGVELTGVLFGRFDQGSISVEDDGTTPLPLKVYGGSRLIRIKPLKGAPRLIYQGYSLRFRATGTFHVRINATGVDLSAAGQGTAALSTNFDPDFAGEYSADQESYCDAGFGPLPETPRTVPIGTPAPDGP